MKTVEKQAQIRLDDKGRLWIDDTNVKVISNKHLLNPEPPNTPYLLFYRRLDTLRSPPPIGGHSNDHIHKSKKQR